MSRMVRGTVFIARYVRRPARYDLVWPNCTAVVFRHHRVCGGGGWCSVERAAALCFLW